jgi:hypothetical protein
MAVDALSCLRNATQFVGDTLPLAASKALMRFAPRNLWGNHSRNILKATKQPWLYRTGVVPDPLILSNSTLARQPARAMILGLFREPEEEPDICGCGISAGA